MALPRAIAALFARIDRNGDASLTRKELVLALATDDKAREMCRGLPGLADRLHPARMRASIAAMDADGDSQITLEEFQKFVVQVAEDHKFEEMRAQVAEAMRRDRDSQQQHAPDPDALPNIAKAMVLKNWMRHNGRSARIAAEHTRRRWLARGLEAFCLAGWGVDCSNLELARLHRAEYDARAVVLEAERMLAWPGPGGVEAFREAERLAHKAQRRQLLVKMLQAWRAYVAAAHANIVTSIAYWARYNRARSAVLAQEARVFSALSDGAMPDPEPGARALPARLASTIMNNSSSLSRHGALEPLSSENESRFDTTRTTTATTKKKMMKKKDKKQRPHRVSHGTLRLLKDPALQRGWAMPMVGGTGIDGGSTSMARTSRLVQSLRKAVSTGNL
jgi:hypothetical protein